MSPTRQASAAPSLRKAAALTAPLSAPEEQTLAKAARGGDKRALDTLLRAHFRLVFTIAHEFGNYGCPLDELVSEGLVGLVEAAERFDTERQVRFAVYAALWIRAYIRRYTLANRRLVRVPSTRNARKLLAHMRETQRTLTQQTGEAPSSEAVAGALGVDVRDVDEMENALHGRDIPCGVEVQGRTFEPTCGEPSPEALVAQARELQDNHVRVQSALRRLNTRERRVVEERGLRESARSLADIGRDLGISRERVRQIEHEAQTKMRRALFAAVA